MIEKVMCKTCDRWSKITIPNQGRCSHAGPGIIVSGDELSSCVNHMAKPPTTQADTAEVLAELKALRERVAVLEQDAMPRYKD